MSGYCKTIYRRGKYFIATGTAQTFSVWVFENKWIVKYTPKFLLERICDLIGEGNKDAAITLWMRVCESADQAPIRIVKNIFKFIFNLIIGGMVVYIFYKAITY